MAGFACSNTQGTANNSMNSDNDSDGETTTHDISAALQNLDTLLAHINIGEQNLSASEFVEMDADTPVFNECSDADDTLIIAEEECDSKKNNNDNEEDDDILTETLPKLIKAMEMVRRLHLLATTQRPQLHSLISQLDSQFTQLFIDLKGVKQTTIDDFFRKN
jgi:predicted RNA-binding protein Jag